VAAVGLLSLNLPGGVPAYVIGNGIASGGFVCLSGIFLPRFFGRRHLGAISGANMACMVIASGLGPLLFGGCVYATGSYRTILLLSMLIPALLALLTLKADNPQRALEPAEPAVAK
jgi:OFA family oxalate/formate antiporter-like MFS transporter